MNLLFHINKDSLWWGSNATCFIWTYSNYYSKSAGLHLSCLLTYLLIAKQTTVNLPNEHNQSQYTHATTKAKMLRHPAALQKRSLQQWQSRNTGGKHQSKTNINWNQQLWIVLQNKRAAVFVTAYWAMCFRQKARMKGGAGTLGFNAACSKHPSLSTGNTFHLSVSFLCSAAKNTLVKYLN